MALSMALPMILPMNPKRKREDDERETHPAAKFLISKKKKSILATNTDHVYICRTCNMEFSSFQALGGHTTGHKNRSKIDADVAPGSVPTKSHTCSYCNKNFASGQALGGHMRKHQAKPDSPNRKIIVPESFKEDKIMVLKTEPVIRDFFSREPVQVEKEPVKIVPVLGEDDPWLELTLGPSCNYRKD